MKNLIDDIEQQEFVVGFKQVSREIASGRVKKVYLARDCDNSFVYDVKKITKRNGIELEMCGSKDTFSSAVRIDVPCGVIAILA